MPKTDKNVKTKTKKRQTDRKKTQTKNNFAKSHPPMHFITVFLHGAALFKNESRVTSFFSMPLRPVL